MKRSYPYTGPASNTVPSGNQYTGQQSHTTVAPPQPAAPPGSSSAAANPSAAGPDYSNYGYGHQQPSSSKMTPEEQQAQWHQQWQQYYAQQAAAAAATGGSATPHQQPHQHQQPMQHHAGPQAQQPYGSYPQAAAPPHQQPAGFYPQQQQQGHHPQGHPQQGQYAHGPYGAPAVYQGGMPGAQQPAGPNPPYGPQQPQQNPYYPPHNGAQAGPMMGGGGSSGPPAKRQRFDGAAPGGPNYNAGGPMQGSGYPPQQPAAQWGGPATPSGPAAPSSYGWPGASSPTPGPQMMGMGANGMNGPSGPSSRGGGAMRTPSSSRGGFGGVNAISPAMNSPMGGQNGGHQQGGAPSIRGGRGGIAASNGGPPKMSSRGPQGKGGSGPGGFTQQQQSYPSRGAPGSFGGPSGSKGGAGPSNMRGGGMNASRGGSRPVSGAFSHSQQQKWGSANGPAKSSSNKQPPTGPGAARSGTPASSKGSLSRAHGGNVPSSPALSNKPVSIATRAAGVNDQPVPSTSKRTFTDFRIKAVEIPLLDWAWSLRGDFEREDEDNEKLETQEDGADGDAANGSEDEQEQGGAENEVTVEGSDDESTAGDTSQISAKNGGQASAKRRASASKQSVHDSSARMPPQGPAAESSKKETSRLRICFAAVTASPPVGAPSGPKAKISAPSGPSADKKHKKPKAEVKEEPADEEATASVADVTELSEPIKDGQSSTGSKKKKKKRGNAEAAVKVEGEEDEKPSTDRDAGADADAEMAVDETAAIKAEDKQDNKVEEAASTGEVAPTNPTVEGWSGYTKTPPQGSPNRVSISYFGTKRRLVIDAEVVKALKVFRAEGRIEITVSVTPSVGSLKGDAEEGKEWMLCKGVLIETRDRDSDHFAALARPDLQYAWDNETELEPRPESTKQGKKSKGRNGRQTQQTPQKKQKRSTTVGDDHQSGDEDNDDASGDDEAEGSVAATTAADEEEEDETPKVERSEEEMLVPSGPYNTLPPLFRLAQSSSGVDESTVSDSLDASAPPQELVINVYLDKLAPLSEAKWLKTGDVEDWLSALPGFAHSRLSDQSWHQKIHVDDPDPPPTIFDVFADWGTKSFLGTGRDRRRFVLDCLSDSKGQVEILCRLVRGERASTVSSKELAVAGGSGKRNPLAEAAKMTSFTSHQTHLSLAVMAMFGLTAEYAEAAGEKQESFDGRISEILMGLPQNLVFKALDGLWKEVMEKNARVSAAAARSAASSIKSSAASASSKATPTSKQPTPVGPSTAGAPSQKRKASSGPAAEDASPSAKENGSGGAASSTSPATPLQAAGQEGGSSSKKARSSSRNLASTPAAAGAAPSETISALSDTSKIEVEAENGDEEEEEEDELESEALQEGRDEGAAHREDEGDEKTAAADAYADEAEGEEQADADEVDGDQEDGGDEEAEEEVEEEDEGEAPSVHVETHGPADEDEEGEGEAVVVLERDNGEEEEQG